jgi:hypothetical protein
MLSVVEIRQNISLVETGDLWVSKQTGWCEKYRKIEHNLSRSYERIFRLQMEPRSGEDAPFTLLACSSETDDYRRGLQKLVCRMREKTRR